MIAGAICIFALFIVFASPIILTFIVPDDGAEDDFDGQK